MAYSVQSIALDCEPLDIAALFHQEPYFSFLDSSRSDGGQGRFSVLAWAPETLLRSKGLEIETLEGGVWTRKIGDPLVAIDALLADGASEGISAEPFIGGGAIGYLGYDLFRVLEPYRANSSTDDLNLPDCCLGFHDTVLVFDHRARQWTITGRVSPGSDQRRERRIEEIRNRLAQGPPPAEHFAAPILSSPSESNMSREQYLGAVERALEHIAAGDIYQVNLAQRFSQPLPAPPFELFTSLRAVSPSFYGAYLNCGDHAVISSSPELFLRRDGHLVETRPIKGTRPRGRTPEADLALERELLASGKEAAELAMIVDLERNDLGRISSFGGVEVIERRYVERLPTLFHTVAAVQGRLRPGIGNVDILRATFPGGSISGCPKIRAIEIIDTLEPTRRHVYTGAIGFIGFNGNMTLSVAIRTPVAAGGRLYYHVGGGIVADSTPEAEYAETLDKAAAIESAIANVQRPRR